MQQAVRRLMSAALAVIGTLSVHPHFRSGAVHLATPVKHVIVIFNENISFDHYFGTYPLAKNRPGETPFRAFLWRAIADNLMTPLNPNVLFHARSSPRICCAKTPTAPRVAARHSMAPAQPTRSASPHRRPPLRTKTTLPSRNRWRTTTARWTSSLAQPEPLGRRHRRPRPRRRPFPRA